MTSSLRSIGPAAIWDFAISCFEPLAAVTGGIGTYTRMLIELLHDCQAGLRIIVFTASPIDYEWSLKYSRATFVYLGTSVNDGGNAINYIGDEHQRFAYNLAHCMREMWLAGHRFRFAEFPDYGSEGYFALKMRRMSLLEIDQAVVRLHSPEMMLHADNEYGMLRLGVNSRHRIATELYCYRHSDTILYGGNAMRVRIEGEARRQGLDLSTKMVKVPHPYPPMENAARSRRVSTTLAPYRRRIGYIGRLENRKGIRQFVERLCETPQLREAVRTLQLEFHIIGRDVDDGAGRSNLGRMIDAVRGAGLDGHFMFAGHVAQRELYEYFHPRMDGFIFPSVFENYPNALMETLPFGKPTLVSQHGCMPEIGLPFRSVFVFDPASRDVDTIEAFLQAIGETMDVTNYDDVRASHHAALNERYAYLVSQSGASDEIRCNRRPSLNVSFVVPNYRNVRFLPALISSIESVRREGDELIIVDDCSGGDEGELISRILPGWGRLILHDHNEGPSAARNSGAGAAQGDLIQFVDADDLIEARGFETTRLALEGLPDVDMCYGAARTFGGSEHIWMPRDGSPLTCLEENFAHSAILIRRDAFEATGGFSTRLRHHYEDWEFNCRAVFLGLCCEMVPYISLGYRIISGSRNNTSMELEAASRLKVIEVCFENLSRGPSKGLVPAMGMLLPLYLVNWIASARHAASIESEARGSAPTRPADAIFPISSEGKASLPKLAHACSTTAAPRPTGWARVIEWISCKIQGRLSLQRLVN